MKDILKEKKIRQTKNDIKTILKIMDSPYSSAKIIKDVRELLAALQSTMDEHFQSQIDEIEKRHPDLDSD